MAFKLSNADHNKLDELLGNILDGYKHDKFSKSEAIADLAHILTACVNDNEGELKAWIKDL